jgi:hypothetical protein
VKKQKINDENNLSMPKTRQIPRIHAFFKYDTFYLNESKELVNMVQELEMKVYPSFSDDSCTITFSFTFQMGKTCIGKANISTSIQNLRFGKMPEPFRSIAYCNEFEIAEEFRESSIGKILEFLKIIGIERYVYYSDHEMVV